ncbi:MAG: 1-acyl-sn-glycerol-3-phosphate acyltransferase [Candidatus Marinimicrobia bacterium]|jgi:1-acyl-sn-glycerol-3-phosphate acyltransferase|nr:1-acyl-sn-glycerol-3-phosphate acyltransferase [Candidatus Neomarinimicrobiota bacterium]MBT4362623.1 1-acyl-sn-glycerol-3-phosphate acyltransferase [Candidatus Neomarinimicrobiota bacterium]MBT4713446.1 1-acyl-sn-glycerol-3-phosphate acyltransferase [Candidatus Neomarinimicrobiota bacterium]MBT4944616.1 1-acyl-sn-glycerol-3-phosphate acyltransferase [Candidatus Neomarinimicrobiota bacterium]MBT5270678.1 1-acyl-sn-glycerol-3-phosphate acyltransferase [Candidatus Neomarinimicrobiota bacterium
MRTLLSLYYWIVGWGYYAPVLLILFFRSYFQPPQAYDTWLRRRTLTLFKILNCDLQIEYAEALPTGEPLIFMANHGSLMDLPLLKAIVPEYYVGMLAENHTNYPIYGSLVKRMGNIPIRRENIRASLKSFNLAKQKLQEGFPIVVLPEGGRSKDGQLIPFKRLVFRFAKESGAHIVPISFSGVFNIKNKESLHLNPGPIMVRFQPIIRAEIMADMELDEVLSATYNAIYDGLEPFEAGKLNANN